MRYYFDLREGDRVSRDDEGMELPSIARVQEEAARSLADMARDAALTGNTRGGSLSMSVQVHDGKGPLLRALFQFEAGRHKP